MTYHNPGKNHHLQCAAQIAVARALNSGIIARPDHCSSCSKECAPEGHHEDYSRPLDLIWLCRACHRKCHVAPRGRRVALRVMIPANVDAGIEKAVAGTGMTKTDFVVQAIADWIQAQPAA